MNKNVASSAFSPSCYYTDHYYHYCNHYHYCGYYYYQYYYYHYYYYDHYWRLSVTWDSAELYNKIQPCNLISINLTTPKQCQKSSLSTFITHHVSGRQCTMHDPPPPIPHAPNNRPSHSPLPRSSYEQVWYTPGIPPPRNLKDTLRVSYDKAALFCNTGHLILGVKSFMFPRCWDTWLIPALRKPAAPTPMQIANSVGKWCNTECRYEKHSHREER